jgi:Ca2+-binding EF-hand superfamily protein
MITDSQSFNRKDKKIRWTVKKALPPLLSPFPITCRYSVSSSTLEKLSTRSLSPDPKPLKSSLQPILIQQRKPLLKFFVIPSITLLKSSLKGFFHTVKETKDHIKEMQDFFNYCQIFFEYSGTFKYLLNEKGQIFKCFHEIDKNTEVVVVSDSLTPQKPGNESVKNSYHCKSDKRLSRFSKLNQTESISRKSSKKKTSTRKSLEKFQLLKNIKLGMSNLLKDIEKNYPNIDKFLMKELKTKFKLPAIKILSLTAKFKTLILLSCSINPNHNIKSGISKKAFIEFQNCGPEKAFVLERIFSSFDSDLGGTISWNEFLSTVSLVENGSNSEKIDLFFKVYDLDNNGKLSFQEVLDLCKVQIGNQHSESMADELAHYSATLIFDVVRLEYDQEISKEMVKSVVEEKNDQSFTDMFCSFKFLNI